MQDLKPDADILCALRHDAPRLTDELLRVQSDLHPVVEERKERRQRERSDKDGDEAELENWRGGLLHDLPLTPISKIFSSEKSLACVIHNN